MRRKIINTSILAKTCLFAAAFSLGQLVWGHGGVSMEDDMCMLTIGTYQAHFTGYQPESRATQEFCEDIPVVGKSIFVIDFIHDELRGMDVDFRIIKDVKKIGVKATLADLGTKEDIVANTMYYQELQRFPRGTITNTINFTEEGQYIGLVTAVSPDSGREIVSVFPFSVGVVNYAKYVVSIVMILVLTLVFFGIFLYKWKKQHHKDDTN